MLIFILSQITKKVNSPNASILGAVFVNIATFLHIIIFSFLAKKQPHPQRNETVFYLRGSITGFLP